jgi:hypothetical protein
VIKALILSNSFLEVLCFLCPILIRTDMSNLNCHFRLLSARRPEMMGLTKRLLI